MFIGKQQHTSALNRREQEKYENNYIQNSHKEGLYSPTRSFLSLHWYETELETVTALHNHKIQFGDAFKRKNKVRALKVKGNFKGRLN